MPYIQYPGKYKSELNVRGFLNLQAFKIVKKNKKRRENVRK